MRLWTCFCVGFVPAILLGGVLNSYYSMCAQPRGHRTAARSALGDPQHRTMSGSGVRTLVAVTLSSCEQDELDMVIDTWGEHSNFAIVFFGCCKNLHSGQDYELLSITCDSSTVPTSSVIRVLQQRYSDHQWFLVTTSQSYVNLDLLESYLEHWDHSQSHYLGKHASSPWHCDREGFVLSRALLLKLDHGDNVTEKSCISVNGNRVRCQDSTGQLSFEWSLVISPDTELSSIHRNLAVILHPVKNSDMMMLLHLLLLERDQLRQESKRSDIDCILKALRWKCDIQVNSDTLDQLTTCQPQHKSVARQPWAYYANQSTHYSRHYSPCSFGPSWHSKPISEEVSFCLKQYGQSIPVLVNTTCYVKYDANEGVEYVIDGKSRAVAPGYSSHHHRLKVKRTFKDTKILRTENLKNEVVHFVVPVNCSGTNKVNDFLEMILSSNYSANVLWLVLYGEEFRHDVVKVIDLYRKRYPKTSTNIVHGSGEFSRSKAINLGMEQLNSNDLAFICDVDIVIADMSYLDRCALNTAQGKRVYFPEVFKYYSAEYAFRYSDGGAPIDEENVPLTDQTGHWGYYGYGMVCIYKSDFDRVGGMDNSIKGWGLEDTDFFKRVEADQHLEIMRAPDPALRHPWHHKNCLAITGPDKYEDCYSSKSLALGGKVQLARYVMDMEQQGPSTDYTDKA